MKKLVLGLLLVAGCENNCHPDQQHVLSCIAACSPSGVQSITYSKCVCKDSHNLDAGTP